MPNKIYCYHHSGDYPSVEMTLPGVIAPSVHIIKADDVDLRNAGAATIRGKILKAYLRFPIPLGHIASIQTFESVVASGDYVLATGRCGCLIDDIKKQMG